MIEQALRSALIEDSVISDAVSDRVYPATAPDNATRPYIVYRVVNQSDGNIDSEQICRFDVEVFSKNTIEAGGYSSAVAISRAVKRVGKAMSGQHQGLCIHSAKTSGLRDTMFRPTNQHGRLVELYFRYIED